ncbi:MAG: lysophospholipase [Leptospiraceae bacterium]|nr:lysophospholipase [Leptospiraceae bacterium]
MAVEYQNHRDKIITDDGLRLFTQAWVPPRPKKHLVIHHGFGEHSDRYGNVLRILADQDMAIYAFDARGHGRSQGKKGDCSGIERYVTDLELFLLHIKEKWGVRKPYLLGHSMGGLVAAAFATTQLNQWEIKALLLSAPGLRVKLTPLMQLKKSAGYVLRMLKPDLIMEAGLDLNFLSHDRGVITAYQKDPLVHGKVSVRMALSLLNFGEVVLEKAYKVKLPVWIGHGSDDGIADPSGSMEFYEKIASTDRSMQIYEGLYHEIFNEIRPDPLLDLRNWLSKH